MALPNLSGVGRCTADPEMRFAPSGTAVASVNLAFNSRRKNPQTNEWEDGDVLFIKATAFAQVAENMAETLTKGAEVIVSGRVKLDQWEDKQTGEKRSAPSLLIDAIGPNLRDATAAVRKADRQNATTPGEQGDPWNRGTVDDGRSTEEPPF